MRYIVIFLLLANLVYLGWNYYQPAPSAPASELTRPLLNNGLMLLSEFEVVAAEQARLNAEAARLCAQITGFASVDDANSLIAAARALGLQATLELTGTALAPRFRVFLPPASSRSIATITLDSLSERIRNAGMQIETYLITRGLLENAIALGVFTSLSAAEMTRQQLQELGYEAEIEEIPRSDGDIEVWLKDPDSDQVGDTEWLDLSAERPELSRAENLCQTIAQVSQFP